MHSRSEPRALRSRCGHRAREAWWSIDDARPRWRRANASSNRVPISRRTSSSCRVTSASLGLFEGQHGLDLLTLLKEGRLRSCLARDESRRSDLP